jgi:4'-phosphopantetheinyl transferase
MTLFPVILPIHEAEPGLSGEERVARLSRIAREALSISARKSGIVLGELEKDEDDVPCPSNGTHWSLSHKPRCVAAVVSDDSIGIDIEEIEPRAEPIFGLVASDEEWELGGGKDWDTFFRYWTAKEAVLKVAGIGIGGLKKCRVTSIPDDNNIVLNYKDQLFKVEHKYYRNHIASVLKGDNEVQWIIAEDFGHS